MTTETRPVPDAALAPTRSDTYTAATLSLHSDPDPIPVGLWISTDCPDAFQGDFYEIMVVVAGRGLSLEQANRLAGCTGYALRVTLAGEELPEPTVTYWREEDGLVTTILEFAYDSTKSIRSDPDHVAAFDTMRAYISDGTPIRKTDRAGSGTRGTRLLDGLGDFPIALYVR